jgi:hypothetical protein
VRSAALLFLAAIVAFAFAVVALGIDRDIVALPLFLVAFAFLLATFFLKKRS